MEEKRIRSHIGIPNVLEKQFTNADGYAYVLNIDSKKILRLAPKNIGVQKGYFDSNAEKYLSQELETGLGKFLHKFNYARDGLQSTNLIYQNLPLITEFIKIQFLRSPKGLGMINKYSISSKIFGDLNPSQLIYFSKDLNSNLLQLIKGECCARTLFSNELDLVTNSLGFCLWLEKNEPFFFIPTCSQKGIVIGGHQFQSQVENFSHINVPKDQSLIFNKHMIIWEKTGFGLGFVLCRSKELVESLSVFLK